MCPVSRTVLPNGNRSCCHLIMAPLKYCLNRRFRRLGQICPGCPWECCNIGYSLSCLRRGSWARVCSWQFLSSLRFLGSYPQELGFPSCWLEQSFAECWDPLDKEWWCWGPFYSVDSNFSPSLRRFLRILWQEYFPCLWFRTCKRWKLWCILSLLYRQMLEYDLSSLWISIMRHTWDFFLWSNHDFSGLPKVLRQL